MTLQYSTTVRNGQNDQITSAIGASGLLRIYTGSPPVNVAAAETGTKLAELTCNATFAPASSGGALTLNSITGANGLASGTAGYFRLLTSGATAHVQGTVTVTGGGGDLTLANTSINNGQPVTVTSAVITAGGA